MNVLLWTGLVQPLTMDVLPPWLLLSKHLPKKGLVIDVVQTRKPMGLPKIQHIRELLSMPDVNEQFTARYQRAWTEEDVVELNRLFEKHLFASLENYTDPYSGSNPNFGKIACRRY